MKHIGLTLILLCSAGAAGAQAVDVGRGNWDSLPTAAETGSRYLSASTMEQIEALAENGACNVPGMRRRRVNLNVPFVLRFDAAGQVERIVIRDVGCPALERVLGGAVQEMAIAGTYRPTRGAGWHRSTIEFSNHYD